MSPEASSPASNRFPVIMVIDDDSDMLDLCAVLLRREGYSILRAQGSAEALEISETYPGKIDLMLVDMLLYPPAVQLDAQTNTRPRVHGDQLLLKLRNQRPLTRFVLMSAASRYRLSGRGMGGVLRQYPFLEKPFRPDDLLDVVRDALSKPVPPLSQSGHNHES
jgi:DNA-binding NtrC family response regulator